MTGLPTSPQINLLSDGVYRRRFSASVMAPAATRTMTMTVASASTEARVPYQLFQSSSMRWPLSSARPAPIKSTLSKGRAFANKNTMLRFAARVLIARQHDLCQIGAATFRTLAYRAKVDIGRCAVSRPDRERDRLDLNPGMLAETAFGTYRTLQRSSERLLLEKSGHQNSLSEAGFRSEADYRG
jgi:hypothetical protein